MRPHGNHIARRRRFFCERAPPPTLRARPNLLRRPRGRAEARAELLVELAQARILPAGLPTSSGAEFRFVCE